MNAIFPSSRPNISVRVIPKIPATMVGAGGIGISKENGVWTIEPSWDDLQLIAPGVLLDPTSKEIWVHDPATDIYNRMTLGGLGQALFWGTSTSSLLISAGSKTFVTQSGKDWPVGGFVQAFNPASITNYMIGQVTAYSDTSLTVNVLAIGGSGTHANWTIVPSTLPGAGAPGANGTSGGLNYRFVAGLSGDPGSGNVGFSSVTIGAITAVRISYADRLGVSLTQEIQSWDDSTTLTNRGKLKVYSPANPNKFFIGTINGPLADGGTFATIPVAWSGGQTLPDVADCQVEMYRTGDVGAQGPTGTNGTNGIDGAGGARYNWDTNTAATDPTTGKIKINNPSMAAATQLYLSETTSLAQNIAALIATFDDNGSATNRGTLSIVSLSDPTHFAVYRVSGNVVDNGTWVTIPVANVSAGVAFALNEAAHVTFARTGDTGAAGSGSGDMLKSENLSGLTDYPLARTNLGLGTAATKDVGVTTGQVPLVENVVKKAGDTMTGGLVITPSPADHARFQMNAPAGFANAITGMKGNSPRWEFLFGDLTAESGGPTGSTGSDLALTRFSNDGNVIAGNPLIVSRADGRMSLIGDPLSALHATPKQYVDSRGRERLLSSRTYFVRTDGNDSNTGLVDSSVGAFLTITKAIATVLALDLGGFNVTIQVGPGTYSSTVAVSAPWTGAGTVTLQGNVTTPSSVLLSVAGPAIQLTGGSRLSVRGLRLISSTSHCIAALNFSQASISGNMEFGAAGGFHIYSSRHSHAELGGQSYSIVGGANAHFYCDLQGSLSAQAATVTLVGTPAFAQAFAFSDTVAMLYAGGMTFPGTSATGARYSVASNGIINTGGGGANFFPGSTAGSGSNSGVAPWGLYI